MRLRLALAVAAAPLVIASASKAQVVISDTRSTPIQTSNAANGQPADVVVEEDGEIEVNAGVALRGDSDNDITLEEGSLISIEEAEDGATGILLDGGFEGELAMGGVISITDDYEAEDEDEDGDADGPYATGERRFGIRIVGDRPRVGAIVVENTGNVSVEGNDSAGISLETTLSGDLTVLGSVSVRGDRSTAIALNGAVEGDVLLSGGSVAATGEDVVALDVSGPVAGRLQIQSSISSNGYRYTSQPTALADLDEEDAEGIEISDDSLYLEDLDADDLLISGPAVRITADIAGGVLLDRAPSYGDPEGEEGDDDGDGVENGDEDWDGDGEINSEDEDLDGDGIPDDDEASGSIASYGPAPAIVIAGAQDVRVGVLDGWSYGLVNNGFIAGYGVYDGVVGNAVLLGGGDGRVVIEGGVLNDGSISASSSEADAVAIRLARGADVSRFVNSGDVSASSVTEGTDTVIALSIEAGATLGDLANSGYMSSIVYGEAGDAIVVRDVSNTLRRITNTGGIYALISPTDNDDDDETDDEVITGRAIAFDLSSSTSGVTILQDGVQSDRRFSDYDGDDILDDDDDDDDDDGIPDAEDDDDNDDDNDGVDDEDEPYIYGDILLGSGSDVIDLRNGSIVGDIGFGLGEDRFSISGGAAYSGALSDADGRLSLDIQDGLLDGRQLERVGLTSLAVGASGELAIRLDPATGAVGGYDVAGPAHFESGSRLSITQDSLVDSDGERYVLVNADSLLFDGDALAGLQGDSPYMTVTTLLADEAAGELSVEVRRRSAQEMGLNANESRAYDAFYASVRSDEDVMDVFLAQTEREDFINLYEQTLPDHSGGTLTALSGGIDAVSRALSERNETLAPGQTSGWIQQINFYDDKDRTDTYGYRTKGFGAAAGVERAAGPGIAGVTLTVSSGDITDHESEAEELLAATLVEIGLYARAQRGAWSAWARGGVGYASFDSERAIVAEDFLYVNNESNWDGYTLSAAAGLSHQARFGRLGVRSSAYATWFSLSESDRVETDGGDAFDLAIDEREGSLGSATAIVALSYGLGRDEMVRPELRLGWREVFHADYGETTARYLSGTDSFTLSGEPITGGGPVVGLGLNIGHALSLLSVSAEANMLDDYIRFSFQLKAQWRF